VPTAIGGFRMEPKIFPKLCVTAQENPDVNHVLVVDEISRCDVTRVFGEALTYIEIDKRGQAFTLASGTTMQVPKNLVIVATMNPWDKGVDDLDIALLRRFAQIDVSPSATELSRLLTRNGADTDFITKLIDFFNFVQAQEDESCHIGHAYFIECTDLQRAEYTWRVRLAPFFKRACRLDFEQYRLIDSQWRRVIAPLGSTVGTNEDVNQTSSSSPS
jgi:5-methylcytosine-specific restriction protein B